MPSLISLIGQKFNRLMVIDYASADLISGNRLWLCNCICGTTIIVRGDSLRTGNTQSCGCLQKEIVTKHGHTRSHKPTPTWNSWRAMIKRCYDPNYTRFNDWGGRGIKVCDRWRTSFENFLQDMGLRPKDRTLDRIDNNGDYKPSNCRWATPKQQCRNRIKRELGGWD